MNTPIPERLYFSARHKIAKAAGVELTGECNAIIQATLDYLRTDTAALASQPAQVQLAQVVPVVKVYGPRSCTAEEMSVIRDAFNLDEDTVAVGVEPWDPQTTEVLHEETRNSRQLAPVAVDEPGVFADLIDEVNDFLRCLDDYPERLVPINRECAMVRAITRTRDAASAALQSARSGQDGGDAGGEVVAWAVLHADGTLFSLEETEAAARGLATPNETVRPLIFGDTTPQPAACFAPSTNKGLNFHDTSLKGEIDYDGGPYEFRNVSIDDATFVLTGAALRTAQFLELFRSKVKFKSSVVLDVSTKRPAPDPVVRFDVSGVKVYGTPSGVADAMPVIREAFGLTGAAPALVPPRYRMLRPHVDEIEAADEFLQDDAVTWDTDPHGVFVGSIYGYALRPARRRINGLTVGGDGGGA